MDIKALESQSQEHATRGQSLLLVKPKTEEEYQEYVNSCNAWVSDCFNMYATHLPEKYAKFFGEGFKQKNNMYIVNIPFHTPDIEDKRKKIHSDIKDKISKLNEYLEMIKISDILVNPQMVEEEQRSKFSIKQKELLILFKLHQYGDYKSHEVNYILWSNGIEQIDYREATGMIKSLEDMNFVKAVPTARFIMASITSEGKKYIEEFISEIEKENKDTSATKKDIDSINERLDEVIELLKRNDMGNEIIFSELDELREAGNKLNIKNWKQLVKGKLYDMAIGKATGLGVDALQDILKTLTGEDVSKLLK